MVRIFVIAFLFSTQVVYSTTIAIIDTGFDLDLDFLKPKILKQETDEEAINPTLKGFRDWQFHNNSHLKEPVIKDQSILQEVLLYRNLKAKGHREGLSLQEFEWFKKKRSDKKFLEMVKDFKKHTHGTSVAGVALREGENINIFPIRGLHIPIPVLAVEDNSNVESQPSKLKNPEERFKDEIKLSQDRVIRKFSKICRYLSLNSINVVNASYGITNKNINSKFQEKYREITGQEIDDSRLSSVVNEYFQSLYKRSSKIIAKYPKMLFVFSAGNSGLDNDSYHHYPSRIKLPNTITVGAINGEFLASFSNYGVNHVDIGAPGVAILSLLPKIYSTDGRDIYSPTSGTSMAAPYISNLAAQIMNNNQKLSPPEVKAIILATGDEKSHLKSKLLSGSVVNNQRAIKAALLSRDMKIESAITLARSDLIPMEDSISFGQPPAIPAEALKEKVLGTLPVTVPMDESDELLVTTPLSSELSSPEIAPQDNSVPPALTPQAAPETPVKIIPSNQNEEQSPQPAVDLPPSSSLDSPLPDQTQLPKP